MDRDYFPQSRRFAQYKTLEGLGSCRNSQPYIWQSVLLVNKVALTEFKFNVSTIIADESLKA